MERNFFLFVIVNNDYQRSLKGSKPFMKEEQRRTILKNIKSVDDVIVSIDDNKFVDKTIELIVKEMGDKFDRIIFTNGGDQTAETIGEKEVCERLGIEMVFGLGVASVVGLVSSFFGIAPPTVWFPLSFLYRKD